MKQLIFFLLLFALACSNNTAGEKVDGQQEETLTTEEKEVYLNKGKQVVGKVGSALISQLTGVLNAGAPIDSAVRYCNTIAYPLVDTLAKDQAILVKRVSNKFRNPADAPNEREKAVLARFRQGMNEGQDVPAPVLEPIDAQTIGYYQPIMVMELCLKCHGEVGKDIAERDYQTIKELYPQDKATGYRVGDLRGMWTVHLKKQ